jgi:hypothetical protein
MSDTGTALAEAKKASGEAPPPGPGAGTARKIAAAGVAVYGLGMLSAMIGTAILSGDWLLTLLVLPQTLFAVLCGAGAMGAALLAPDPYLKGH